MNRFDEKKIAVLKPFSEVFAIIAGIFLSVASLCMFINMITRTAADFNLSFVYELCSLCACGVASFAIPYATLNQAHSVMDLILSHLNPRVRGVLEFVSGIFTVAILGFTIVQLYKNAIMYTAAHELTTTAHLPAYMFRWVFAIGMTLTLIAAAIDMIDSLRTAKGTEVTPLSEITNAAEAELEAQIQEAIAEAEHTDAVAVPEEASEGGEGA